MRFYMTPGSCSTGIHILLEELGLVFEAHLVNLPAGDQYSDDFLAINPKGTIPVLVLDDGTALTEFQAIAWWLGRRYPNTGLLPADIAEQTRVMEVMSHVIGTIHMQGFARIFTTEKFTPDPAGHESVRQRGQDIVTRGFAVIDTQLSPSGLVLEQLSIADMALFYVEFWADRTGIRLPIACQRHYRLMLQRPAVRQVLAEEGYSARPVSQDLSCRAAD